MYRDRNYTPINLSKLDYHPDVENMSALFAPRKINTDLLVEINRIQRASREPDEVHSDSEDEETWKPTCRKGCCVN